MKTINLYTDGGCANNQSTNNIGGWGSILEYKQHKKELYGGAVNTTNNIMELTAVIEGLKAITDVDFIVNVFSDSAYVVNCFRQEWYKKWMTNNWKNSKKEPVENKELWVELIDLVEKFEKVTFFKVKGHINITKTSELNKWFKKFKDVHKLPEFEKDDYIYLTTMNIRADELANMGIDERR